MSLRTKLLLLSLLTLVLPWAGWQYAQQMETTLRRGQEDALLTTAQVLSRVVASEPELLYRVPDLRREFDPARGDLFAPLLVTRPLLDGFPDEWPQPARAVPGFDPASRIASANAMGPEPKVRLGVHGRSMHLYVEVTSQHALKYEVPARDDTAPPGKADRVIVLHHDEFGHERAWSISAIAPGPLLVRACEVGAPWKPSADEVQYVEGIWRETDQGYAIELRAPLNLFGTQIAIQALDAGGSIVAQTRGLAWIHAGSEALKQRLEQYAPDGVRVSVVDTHGWLLARAGSIGISQPVQYPGLERDDEGF